MWEQASTELRRAREELQSMEQRMSHLLQREADLMHQLSQMEDRFNAQMATELRARQSVEQEYALSRQQCMRLQERCAQLQAQLDDCLRRQWHRL